MLIDCSMFTMSVTLLLIQLVCFLIRFVTTSQLVILAIPSAAAYHLTLLVYHCSSNLMCHHAQLTLKVPMINVYLCQLFIWCAQQVCHYWIDVTICRYSYAGCLLPYYQWTAMINTIIKIFIKEFIENGSNLRSKDANFIISGIPLPPVSKVNL